MCSCRLHVQYVGVVQYEEEIIIGRWIYFHTYFQVIILDKGYSKCVQSLYPLIPKLHRQTL